MVVCHTNAARRLNELASREIRRVAGTLSPRHVVIKPNWVLHQSDERSPITAMVTDARVITAVATAAAEMFPDARITIGDCPLQRADWPLMCEQSGLAPAIADLEQRYSGRVSFRDLRKEVFVYQDGRLVEAAAAPHGDPLGYVEVRLGAESHLDAVSDRADRFAIHDHDRAKTRQNHRRGDHRYFVSRTFLDADLFINLPKWKTHSKAALTGALKNLVGINGDKAYLPHFTKGAPKWGGDEYWDRGRFTFWAQNTLRDYVRDTPWAHRLVRPPWLAFKAMRSAVLGSHDGAPPDFYVGGGSWYGNQTIWRMIYDLNMILQRADRDGVLQRTPQRAYLCIVDGLICGEGDGPLYAQPRPLDWLVAGTDPFAIDAALAWFMGFDVERMPILTHRTEFIGGGWGGFALDTLPVTIDGETQPLTSWPIRHDFLPPPGWLSHVERLPMERAS